MPVAGIARQHFFRRYHRFCGTGSDLAPARRELTRVYGLAPVALATPSTPPGGPQGPMRAFASHDARWRAVIDRAGRLAELGRPLVVGTDTAADATTLAACLAEVGIETVLLDGRDPTADVTALADAGRVGTVTVLAGMAGLGGHVVLDGRALRAGGLHVINCQHNPTRRQDRRLLSLAARPGQPGSSETWLSLETNAVDGAVPSGSGWLLKLAGLWRRGDELCPPRVLLRLVRGWSQRRGEQRAVCERAATQADHRWNC